MRSVIVFVLACACLPSLIGTTTAHAQSNSQKAKALNKSALSLFETGNKEQALVEFQMAHDLDPQIDYLFMIAQCEWYIGKLQAARKHFGEVLTAEKTGEMAVVAQQRIEAIERRPSRFVINTAPDGVEVTIAGAQQTFTGQAPNEFEVPHGKYRVTVSKANYLSHTQEEEIGLAATKSLFIQLVPIPANLDIRTKPPGAILYVRGNRAQNPYRQNVEPGSYEIYAEAPEYQSRRESIVLHPGDKRVVDFALPSVQRSGRPELIGFWTAIGAVAGGAAVLARLEDPTKTDEAAPLALVTAAAAVGGISGALVSTAFVPDYIRDNLALFRIGAMWIGATEGAAAGLALSNKLSIGWMGGGLGLAVGTVLGSRLDVQAPNYGRGALIQSGAVIGALAGALALPAFHLDGGRRTSVGVLVGLNAGLSVGLAMAYLPDQHEYGPSWSRVILVDLAAAGGAFAGALTGTIDNCLARSNGNPNSQCAFESDARTAQLALVGGGLGLAAGWLLTRGFDKRQGGPSESTAVRFVPAPSAMAVAKPDGGAVIVPGLVSRGRF